jgi:diaminohydroxyphosphoribosylaminopyrimidine deaminase/5-amino-6-(5-phosphoribosylamino)uracil reductase
VRLLPTVLQPLRVVVDSRLQTPPAARLLDPPGKVLIACAQANSGHADALRARGAEVALLPGEGACVDLHGLVQELGRRAINEVHVEAGAVLNGALLASGLIDELLLYQAPLIVGPGRGLAAVKPLPTLSAAPRFELMEVARCGADLRLRLRPALSGSFT